MPPRDGKVVLVDLDWSLKYLTVDRFDVDPDEGGKEFRRIAATTGFPASEEFVDLLDHHIAKLEKQKVATGVSSPCKAYSFIGNEKGQGEKELFEDVLLNASDLEGFSAGADRIREKLFEMPTLRSGLLVVAKVHLSWDERQVDVLFATLMEFEHAEKIGEELDLEGIDETIIRDPRQAFFYPFVIAEDIRYDLVKLLNRPASHCWSAMFYLRPPPTTEQLLQAEVAKALKAIDPDGWEGREPYFASVAPKKRALGGEMRLVKHEHQLGLAETAAVARESSRTARDLYGIQQPLKVSFAGGSADLDPQFLGHDFVIAEEGGHQYLVIKSELLKTRQGALGAVDFLRTTTLEEACEILRGDS